MKHSGAGVRFPATVKSGALLTRCNLQVPMRKAGDNNRMFILGMGYVGQFFGTHLKNNGWVVSGTCTSISNQIKLAHLGFDSYLFDANQPRLQVLDILNHHTHLLISIPPIVGVGDPLLQHRQLLHNRFTDGDLRWLGYLSSTSMYAFLLPSQGVYGDSGGAWVDEDYPVNPESESAKARAAAEIEWFKFGNDLQIATQVFRLGGIYGPGRSAIDTIIKQEPLSKKQKTRSFRQYTSRIHVSDICQALSASINRSSPGNTYNLVDDNPAPRSEVFKFAQSLVRKKWPGRKEQMIVAEEADLVAGVAPRGEKRVSNTRMKKDLGELDLTKAVVSYPDPVFIPRLIEDHQFFLSGTSTSDYPDLENHKARKQKENTQLSCLTPYTLLNFKNFT